MSRLFESLTLRGLTFRNRVFMSPMCQHCAMDSIPDDWHFGHYGTRAVGGVGLVIVEATAITSEGRISPGDLGIWSGEQVKAFQRITRFIREQGAVAGIQIAHAGRKASTDIPWKGGGPLGAEKGGWPVVAPSPIPFSPRHSIPRALSEADLRDLLGVYETAARLALEAGFEVIEVHMAHGYLLHEFLSPITNKRTDAYGGPFDNRVRFPLEAARTVRRVWPDDLPVFVRISATDWVEGGWDLEQSVRLARALKDVGIDLIDCSSGGLVEDAVIPAGPGFQAPFAAAVRERAGIAAGAVGFITSPAQAEQIVAAGQADAVLLGRVLLRDPYWALHAARTLGADVHWPPQYLHGRA
ncbi:MAG: NADH:flavin oxidoreductase/NADH oxidase [Nitrospirae bacterium]|nr:NADH:flavin oxidoreductase/NADH oxidase [Nitrospirota bacterium]